jgi:hypothetical protein
MKINKYLIQVSEERKINLIAGQRESGPCNWFYFQKRKNRGDIVFYGFLKQVQNRGNHNRKGKYAVPRKKGRLGRVLAKIRI